MDGKRGSAHRGETRGGRDSEKRLAVALLVVWTGAWGVLGRWLRVRKKCSSGTWMWLRKAFPSPAPSAAPFTRPAMSVTWRYAEGRGAGG